MIEAQDEKFEKERVGKSKEEGLIKDLKDTKLFSDFQECSNYPLKSAFLDGDFNMCNFR